MRRLWRRLPALEAAVQAGTVPWPRARASVASWFGLAKHAHAFRLSRSVFAARDVYNVGKRLLVRAIVEGRSFGSPPDGERDGWQ